MKAADVMVSKVITVGPTTTIQEVASILLANRISAVPVVGEHGELIGIVSEGDLIRRIEVGTERHRSWWLGLLASNRALATEYVMSNARKVADIMTRRVVTATPNTPLGDIATLLEKNFIKRVPIMNDGKIVGIVSRANLVQALASMAKKTKKKTSVANQRDSEIRKKVISRLNAQPWRPSMLNVTVHDGTVELWGLVTSEDEKKAARIAVEIIPGVKVVNDNLMIPPAVSGMT